MQIRKKTINPVRDLVKKDKTFFRNILIHLFIAALKVDEFSNGVNLEK
ncbi:hypothetical protein KAU13_03175 [candidate division WOR-3 bacterium]|nr:hypothetical protein [candidate division WOR-3 bacterium]